MRIGKIFASVLSLGATAGALVGITGAQTASAASWTYLCTSDGQTGCIYSEGVGNFANVDIPFSGMTNWTYPTVNGTTGTIKQANVNLCLQLDASDGDFIRGAACNGDTAEQWKNVYNPTTKRTMFVSVWELNATHQQECIEWYVYDDSGGKNPLGALDLNACNNSSLVNWGT